MRVIKKDRDALYDQIEAEEREKLGSAEPGYRGHQQVLSNDMSNVDPYQGSEQ